MSARVIVGDCVEVMRGMDECSVDAVVCDPPYLISFMGKAFDSEARLGREMQAWHLRWAREALRVLKPGGHLLAFGGTRTYHRLVAGVEDAGFEVRDTITWLYGSGFPKSLDVSKAIDKAAGAEREVVGEGVAFGRGSMRNRTLVEMGYRPTELNPDGGIARITAPASDDAKRWEGWGTALKPASEPVVVARKPLAGTVSANVLEHGTGAINVDGCRIAGAVPSTTQGQSDRAGEVYGADQREQREFVGAPGGRWPANVVLSHDEDCVQVGTRRIKPAGCTPMPNPTRGGEIFNLSGRAEAPNYLGEDGREEVGLWACVPGCPVRMLDDQSGTLTSGANPTRRGSDKFRTAYGDFEGQRDCTPARGVDKGGASRFFYTAKASRAERNAGIADGRNVHPTVKPIDLMRWLVRLVTPAGGVVLDPFLGSGTTGAAAVLEGVEFIGIEREAEYAAIAEARIAFWRKHPTGLPVEAALQGDRVRRAVRESGQGGLW